MFQKIALAVAFSPRMEALMCETKRFARLFNAEVIFIHIGEKREEEEIELNSIFEKNGFDLAKIKVIWEDGNPSKMIIKICKRENVDLLVTGALKKETFFKYHFSSIARKMMRRSDISLMVLINPQVEPQPFKNIVINGTDDPRTAEVINNGIRLANLEKAKQVHIINEIQLLGLRMSMAGEDTMGTVEDTRRKLVQEEVEKIEHILAHLDTSELKVNIKIVSGKPGYEISKFTEKVKADLLVLRAPNHKLNLLDRFFPHDLEFILNDLPTNLLILQSK